MSGLKFLGKIFAGFFKFFGKGIFKLFYILRRKKIYIPIHFVIGVVPQMLGAYSYLRSQNIEWYYALFGGIGAETGGSLITVFQTGRALLSGTSEIDAIFLVLGAISGVFTLIMVIDIWIIFLRGFATNIGFFPIFITLTIILSATFTNTLFIDEYVLDEDEQRVSGMSYFLENPGDSINPFDRIRENTSNESLSEFRVPETNSSSQINSTESSSNYTVETIFAG